MPRSFGAVKSAKKNGSSLERVQSVFLKGIKYEPQPRCQRRLKVCLWAQTRSGAPTSNSAQHFDASTQTQHKERNIAMVQQKRKICSLTTPNSNAHVQLAEFGTKQRLNQLAIIRRKSLKKRCAACRIEKKSAPTASRKHLEIAPTALVVHTMYKKAPHRQDISARSVTSLRLSYLWRHGRLTRKRRRPQRSQQLPQNQQKQGEQ